MFEHRFFYLFDYISSDQQQYNKLDDLYHSSKIFKSVLIKKENSYAFNRVGIVAIQGSFYFILPSFKKEMIAKYITNPSAIRKELHQHIKILKRYHQDCQEQKTTRTSSEVGFLDIGAPDGQESYHNPLAHFDAAFELWSDFEKNGIWYQTEKKYNTQHSGKIEWHKTLHHGQPLIHDNQILFRDIYRTHLGRTIQHELTQLHLFTCSQICSQLMGGIFPYKHQHFAESEIVKILQTYKNRLFDDRSREIYDWLCEYYFFEGRSRVIANDQHLGVVVRHCYLWEWMLCSVIGTNLIGKRNHSDNANINVSDIFKSRYTNINSSMNRKHFLPDIWYDFTANTQVYQGIIDAKDYESKGDRIGSDSISKQIVYKHCLVSYISQNNGSEVDATGIFNVFASPENSEYFIQFKGFHQLVYDIDDRGKILYVYINYDVIAQAYLKNESSIEILDCLKALYMLKTDATDQDINDIIRQYHEILFPKGIVQRDIA